MLVQLEKYHSDKLDLECLIANYHASQETTTFLTENPFLVTLLNEAVPHLEAYFGNMVEIQLELFRDPDERASRELVARILTDLSPREAIELLNRFDNDWWLDASPRAHCLLNFAMRYL